MVNKGYVSAKSDKASDEYYTPEYAVKPLLKYLVETDTIWCPFDKENSAFVKVLREAGYEVIATHIDDGKNFFFYEPEDYDVIISNPPFSCKDAILARLHELDKPYAMMFPLTTLQGQKRFKDLQNVQALIFDKRINFYTDEEHTKIANGISFATIYICKYFLPESLMFEKLEI